MRKKKKAHEKLGILTRKNNIALKVQDIEFKYRMSYPNAVDGVSFSINHGEYITIIGHNGSGKSTLSKIIIGVLKAQKGSIEVFGNLVTKENSQLISHKLGIVFQNPDNQFIGSTVRDDIAFGLENKCVDPKLMPDIITKYSQMVGMESYLDHEPLLLSGGQKQRVAIASALALTPELIIFDEATSMLDPKGKREVKEIMVQLKESREKTIISITHDMDEIINADKLLVMNKGKVVRFGKPEEILKEVDFLRSIHLDIPFILKVSYGLKKYGVNIDETLYEEELVQQICQKK
ncbi:energy-coupling factor transporter ATPase [Spiroplasma endosymbiont of Eupeodes luniger]|uniref:energy-coupling factor transporter ATPase n=1 Tax=Spiroplasma endosymbiont of Eupeodes luniger TaxID=3066300 RepID=UPI0030D4C154